MQAFITVKEAASILGISLGYAYRLIRVGRIRSVNLQEDGLRPVYRVRREDLEEVRSKEKED